MPPGTVFRPLRIVFRSSDHLVMRSAYLAESCQCLRNGEISFEDFESLISVLPPDNANPEPGDEAKTFTTGAYVYSNLAGLRSNVYKYPATTRLLAAVLHQYFPSRVFTSAGLFRQLKAPPHVDTNNQPGCPNLLLPASQFDGGSVWVAGPGEHTLSVRGKLHTGSLLHVAQGPRELDAQCLHATCDWRGARLILVGFCIKNCASLHPDAAARLDRLGFPLPTCQPVHKCPRVAKVGGSGLADSETPLPSSPLGCSHEMPKAACPETQAPPTSPVGFSPEIPQPASSETQAQFPMNPY